MAFRMFDIDKNNKIDKHEMEKIIESIYDLVGEHNRHGDNAPRAKVKRIMNKLGRKKKLIFNQGWTAKLMVKFCFIFFEPFSCSKRVSNALDIIFIM